MREFIKHFIREDQGSWRCVEPAELKVDGSRIQVAAGTRVTRGTSFMGVDLAALLDREYDAQRPHG